MRSERRAFLILIRLTIVLYRCEYISHVAEKLLCNRISIWTGKKFIKFSFLRFISVDNEITSRSRVKKGNIWNRGTQITLFTLFRLRSLKSSVTYSVFRGPKEIRRVSVRHWALYPLPPCFSTWFYKLLRDVILDPELYQTICFHIVYTIKYK